MSEESEETRREMEGKDPKSSVKDKAAGEWEASRQR